MQDTNVDFMSLQPNASVLNKAARKRIDQYTKTAGINYELLYTELTLHWRNNTICSFNDKEVHQALQQRYDIRPKKFPGISSKGTEWFVTDLSTVKKAINDVKGGLQCLTAQETTIDQSPIKFRPE